MVSKKIIGSKTIRMSADAIEYFDSSYATSGANSQGEFMVMLLDKWNAQEPIEQPQIQTVSIERELQPNEIILNLSPVQLFAIRQTILSVPNFAERQNEIIDILKAGDRPFMYFGDLFDSEFQSLWIKNIVLTNTMSEEQIENAIRFNISAYLVNMFLMQLIEGNITGTKMNANYLKSYVRKLAAEEKAKQAQEQTEQTQIETP